MGEIERILEWAFETGGSSVHINVAQMSLRAAVVYGATVLIVRMGKKRFMSQATAFDVILGIMLGSMVSRAIAGTAPFLPTLAASAALVVVHWLFSAAAARWHAFGKTITEVPAATHRTIRPRRSRDNGAVIVSSIARARSRAPWPKVHGLTVLTNNLRHFEPTGVPVLDPLDALPPDVLPSGSLHPAPDQNGFQVGSGVNLR